jgi:hypothetical protein
MTKLEDGCHGGTESPVERTVTKMDTCGTQSLRSRMERGTTDARAFPESAEEVREVLTEEVALEWSPEGNCGLQMGGVG